MTDTELTELADWAESQLPRLIDDVLARILDQIELYRAGAVVAHQDLRHSVEHNMRYMVAAMRDPDGPHDLAGPRETGRRRARQGAPLPEVLRAFRIGFTGLWDLLTEQVRRSQKPSLVESLLSATSMILRLTDEYAIALTETYRETTAELLVAQQQRRTALAEALFTGEPVPEAGPWEVARLLGLPVAGDLIVVAAETGGMAEESLALIERRLADHGIVSAWRLTPALQMGVAALRPGQLEEMLTLVRRGVSARTGVSPVYRSLRDTPRALHLARVALARVPAGHAEVRVFSSSPLAALVAHDPDEGERVAYQVLGAVLELPTEDRVTLLQTLQAWFDQAGSAERAAEQLYCHPNTVRYRLRRIHELTGRSLSEPYGVADLAAALQALRIDHDR
jgi:hypothetical protein